MTNDENTEPDTAPTKRGRKLAIYLMEKLNDYIKENFQDDSEEDEMIIMYGIDIFFSDCVFSTSNMFREDDESLDQFIQRRMLAFTNFMRLKAEELLLK